MPVSGSLNPQNCSKLSLPSIISHPKAGSPLNDQFPSFSHEVGDGVVAADGDDDMDGLDDGCTVCTFDPPQKQHAAVIVLPLYSYFGLL